MRRKNKVQGGYDQKWKKNQKGIKKQALKAEKPEME